MLYKKRLQLRNSPHAETPTSCIFSIIGVVIVTIVIIIFFLGITFYFPAQFVTGFALSGLLTKSRGHRCLPFSSRQYRYLVLLMKCEATSINIKQHQVLDPHIRFGSRTAVCAVAPARYLVFICHPKKLL